MVHRVDLAEAIALLQQGDVLAYPTEAVWGLGCDPYNQAAFARILQLKQRPIEKGVIVVVANQIQAQPFLSGLSHAQQQRIVQTWQNTSPQQQATTWLVPLTPVVPHWICGQHTQVAIRLTHHPLVQQLCLGLGGALVSTSANPAGLEPARSARQVAAYFPALPVLEGALGSCPLPSRIIDSITNRVIRA